MNTCLSCNSDVPAGTRWCPICHINVLDAQIGRLTSPARRLGAYVLDYLVYGIVVFLTTSIGDAGVILLIVFSIFALILFARGTTPGKMLLGMHVAKENGERAGFFTMFFREVIGKTVSLIAFGLGFLWIILDKENQGWHDKIMSTYVVQR